MGSSWLDVAGPGVLWRLGRTKDDLWLHLGDATEAHTSSRTAMGSVFQFVRGETKLLANSKVQLLFLPFSPRCLQKHCKWLINYELKSPVELQSDDTLVTRP